MQDVARILISALLLAAGALSASAQSRGPMAPSMKEGGSVIPASKMPGPLRQVGYDQRLGETVPGDLVFRDESGRPVQLRNYFARRPVILVLAYYECPMLCDMVLNGLVSSLKSLSFDAGREFDLVVVSIDPKETPKLAVAAKNEFAARYGRAGTDAGLHFLTGSEGSIQRLAQTVGFRYTYVPERDEYAHAAGLSILTPKGRISRYLLGIEFPPRDVRLGLIESSENRIGTAVDQILLYCFHYDPVIGRYSAMTLNILRLTAIATVVGLVLLILLLRRRETRTPRPVGVS